MADSFEQKLQVRRALKGLLSRIEFFCQFGSGLILRPYQLKVAKAIVNSVIYQRGRTFVVIFPRQSGKNELQAQIEAYLLFILSETPTEIVKVSPTWKPQSLNAMRRLERVLSKNLLTRSRWHKEQGYIYRLGEARIYFLSGQKSSNVVGATASTLLECDEAQSVMIEKWDREFGPMAASTNATRVFWGTAWTAQTLLGRERRLAETTQQQDRIRRLFVLDADQVAECVPAYGKYVQGEILKLGRQHPLVRTQYYSQELEQHSTMFGAGYHDMMQGRHPRQERPFPGRMYAFLIDVGGEESTAGGAGASLGAGSAGRLPDEGSLAASGAGSAGRDSTALTIVEVQGEISDPLLPAPTYLCVQRKLWTGVKHSRVYGELKALADLWQPRWMVIDATGVGGGLASFLERTFPGQVMPVVFTSARKSMLGWGFLAVIETGRWKEWQADPAGGSEQALFFQQLEHCQMELLPGPDRRVRWGVPDGTRDAASGELVHDDLVVSASLCVMLEDQTWSSAHSEVLAPQDPLKGLSDVF